jgi:NADH dehydrogenase
MKQKKKLLILGGGYAGVTLIHALKMKNFDITLVNQTPFHIVQTEIHRLLGGAAHEEDIYFDLEEFCEKKGVSFICDKAILINDKVQKVICEHGRELKYDYLVIATGALSLFPHQIENIHAYSKDIKVAQHLKNLENEFQSLLKSKEKEKNIAIIGGGLTGVEIALEYASRLKKLGISATQCSISLIEQFETLLPGSSKELILETHDACDKAGIKRYHGNFVTKIENNNIYLSNNSSIPFSMVIITIGVICEELHFQSEIQKSNKNQFIVDKHLQVKGFENIFAIGDVAYFETDEGSILLPTAQNAKQQAKTLAKNLENIFKNKPTLEYKYKHKGTLVDLAKNEAVGDAFGVQFHGNSAYYLKRTVNAMHTRIFK